METQAAQMSPWKRALVSLPFKDNKMAVVFTGVNDAGPAASL